MKTKTRKLISGALTFALTLVLLTAMPMTTSAASNATTIDIRDSWFGNADYSTADWTYNQSTHAIQAAADVTIVGGNSSANRPLKLSISPGATVTWAAYYSGDVSEPLLELFGNGTFEVVANRLSSDQSSGNAIRSTGEGLIKVSGGTVESARGNAIEGINIEVSGGTVTAKNGNALEATSVTVSGGTVVAGHGNAIRAGGVGANVTISGGFVFALGSDIKGEGNVIYMTSGEPSIVGNAVVCAWDVDTRGAVPGYDAGSSTDLTVSPPGAAAKWDVITYETYPPVRSLNDYPTIRYENGVNKDYYVTDDIMSANIRYVSQLSVVFYIDGSAQYGFGLTPGATVPRQTDNPTKSGFTFAGWYMDDGFIRAYNFDDPVTQNISLYARWSAVGDSTRANFQRTMDYKPGAFTDVDETQWYGYNNMQVIARAYEYGLMEGDDDTTFRPLGNITIAEAITMAARVHSIYTLGYPISSISTPPTPWYRGYVDYAIDNWLISENTFPDYNKEATRAEMATIFARALPPIELPAINNVSALPDVTTATPHQDDIFMLYKAGVLSGDDEHGTFRPGDNIIRAEAAAIICRVILPATRHSGRTFA